MRYRARRAIIAPGPVLGQVVAFAEAGGSSPGDLRSVSSKVSGP